MKEGDVIEAYEVEEVARTLLRRRGMLVALQRFDLRIPRAARSRRSAM